MNRQKDEASDTGRFVFWWIVALGIVLLLSYGSILIARQQGMNGDVACHQETNGDAGQGAAGAGNGAAGACTEQPGAAGGRTGQPATGGRP